MKLVVIGATGGIGRQLVEQGAAAMHEVIAVARDPEGLPIGVRTIAIDLADHDRGALADAVRGADAVVSGLGPRSRGDAGIAERGTIALVEAMRATTARRLLVVSAAPIGTVPSPARPHPPRYDPGDGFVMRHLLAPITKLVFREQYTDLAKMEDVLRGSGLEWTAIRPPRLIDAPMTGEYRTAIGQNLGGGLKIGRADVAHFMLRAIVRAETVGQTVGIAY